VVCAYINKKSGFPGAEQAAQYHILTFLGEAATREMVVRFFNQVGQQLGVKLHGADVSRIFVILEGMRVKLASCYR
jgi:uncharacterized protein (DUF2126 family)